jgi:hypothetical protein
MQFENFNDMILGFELEHKIKKWKRESAKRSSTRKHKIRKAGDYRVA